MNVQNNIKVDFLLCRNYIHLCHIYHPIISKLRFFKVFSKFSLPSMLLRLFFLSVNVIPICHRCSSDEAQNEIPFFIYFLYLDISQVIKHNSRGLAFSDEETKVKWLALCHTARHLRRRKRSSILGLSQTLPRPPNHTIFSGNCFLWYRVGHIFLPLFFFLFKQNLFSFFLSFFFLFIS